LLLSLILQLLMGPMRFCDILSRAGPALSRCNRCSCIGPRAYGGPRPWCLGRMFIFARYSLRSRIVETSYGSHY